jgi:dUTP pyrophosphatase
MENEWIEDVCNVILGSTNDSSDEMCKPKIANIVLEDSLQAPTLHDSTQTTIDKLPIAFIDDSGQGIGNNQIKCMNDSMDMDVDEYGEILIDDIDECEDPVIKHLKQSQELLNKAWEPNLNQIIEENEFDLKLEQGIAPVVTTEHVSNKRHRGRVQRNEKLRKMYEDKIAMSIKRNGIYQAKLAVAQNDGGANRSVTSSKELLVHYKNIDPYPINGVQKGDPAIYCTGTGYLLWRADTGELLLVRCLYCENASGTIISPSDVNMQYSDKYNGWTMETKYNSKVGQLTFNARDGINHLVFSSYSSNNLWFHHIDQVTEKEYQYIGAQVKAVVNTLNTTALYQIWHQRLGHPGHKIMQEASKHCKGIPTMKRPQFFSCNTCNSSKFRKQHIGKTKMSTQSTSPIIKNEVGQHLHIDFGFVRGSDYAVKDEQGKLTTSIDGFRSYCLVIDRASRHISIILTKVKKPPIVELRHLLTQLRSRVKSAHCTVTTDLGGELAKSKSFQNLLLETNVGYTLRSTGAYSSAQNGMAEKPNQDLARMMRSLLYGAGLGSKYWSYALRHSVYLKNCLPHTALDYKTPYEMINGEKPDMSNIRVFGSRVHFMHKPRQKKLDKMDNVGRFMTYKGTDKIAYVIDDATGKERMATHLNYDEAFMSVPAKDHPPMATAIQQSGFEPTKEEICRMKIKLLSPKVQLPQRGTVEAAGLDLYTCDATTIKSGGQTIIPTGIAIELPPGYHAQLQIRSSYAAKYRARIEAGLIDSDYRGQIFAIMSNNGNEDINIASGERFAQMVIVKDPDVTVTVSHELQETNRQNGKFGSTGRKEIPIPVPERQRQSTTAAAATIEDEVEPSVQVEVSTNPFVDIQDITFTSRGKHKTQGMVLQDSDEWMDQVTITTCKPGTATAKIPNWIKRLKNSVLLEINHTGIKSVDEATKILSNISRNTEVHIKVGLQEKLPMHDDQGVPMMYFDQLLTISQHLQHIKNNQLESKINPKETQEPTASAKLAKAIKSMNIKGVLATLHGILPKNKVKSKRLTRTKLKNTKEWEKWKQSEWKQLDQYWGQKMFGEPCPLPPNANVLGLLWYYNIKDDGTLKARMVCNGRPSDKNTVIFGYTYAKSLDHVGSRIFWATAVAKNLIVRGADASNAFAEADGPKIPLYVRLNDQYREWWAEKMGKPPIPRGYVLPVHKALQGHPESPRAWSILIDTILQQKLKLKPTTHEPCLYHGTYKGQEVLFLRQVDDFAVATTKESIATEIINEIDKYMCIKIKDLGN